jgi:hypothetical protein
VGNEAHTFK